MLNITGCLDEATTGTLRVLDTAYRLLTVSPSSLAGGASGSRPLL